MQTHLDWPPKNYAEFQTWHKNHIYVQYKFKRLQT